MKLLLSISFLILLQIFILKTSYVNGIDCPDDCTNSSINFCNTTTGICTCDEKWQSEDCSIRYKPCDDDCSFPQGSCNNQTAKCICSEGYMGKNCSKFNIFISSILPSTVDGGLVKIWGSFGLNHDNVSVNIGQLECQLHTVSYDFINCTIGPGKGTKNVVISINEHKYRANKIYQYAKVVYSCPDDCSGHGVCKNKTGECRCNKNWGGYNCKSKKNSPSTTTTTSSTSSSSSNESPIINLPQSGTTVNSESGSAIIINEKTSYEIKIKSLVEYDFDGLMVNNHELDTQWLVNTSITNFYIFSQTLNDTDCSITYIIEEIIENRDYTFAGLDLTLDKDSIKITVEIKNYPFSSALNSLQLQIESKTDTTVDHGEDDNDCNKENLSFNTNQVDEEQLLNYITISKDQKTLYGRFVNRVISDGNPTFITTSILNTTSNDTLIIGLNLPHCEQNCLIDPDFSLLVSSSYQDTCGSNNDKNNGRASWVLPVAIVVPCVSVAAIIIVGAVIYSKNRTKIILVKGRYSFKLKNLSKKDQN